MAKYCGKCGSKLNKRTGTCPICDKGKSKGKHKKRWIVITSVFLVTVISGLLLMHSFEIIHLPFFRSDSTINQNLFFKEFTEKDVVFENNELFVASQLLISADEKYNYAEVKTIVNELGGKIVGYIDVTNDYQIEFKDSSYNSLKHTISTLNEKIENSEIGFHKVFLINEEDTLTGDNKKGLWWREAIDLNKLESEDNSYKTVNVGIMDTIFDTENDDIKYAFSQFEPLYNDSSKSPSEKHGTNVTGFLCARKGNNSGIDGVANDVSIIGYAYRGTDYHYYTSTLQIKYAIANMIVNNAKIINLSFGLDELSVASHYGVSAAQNDLKVHVDQISNFFKKLINKQYEFVIVKSAGNLNGYNWTECPISEEHPYGYANSYKSEAQIQSDLQDSSHDYFEANNDILGAITDNAVKNRIIIVGSSNVDNKRSAHSVRGSRVDIYAPGFGLNLLAKDNNDSEDSGAGTSFAAPIVSGIVSLMWGVNPGLRADSIKHLLISSATQPIEDERYQILPDSGDTIYMNKYLVNAYNAVNRAKDYGVAKQEESNSENGILMGIARILDENSQTISDAGECNISIYKGDDTDAYKEFTTDGEFDIELEPGEYDIEATTTKGDYTSGRLGFKISKSAVSYMDYLLLFESKPDYSEELFSQLTEQFVFSSGAGAWATTLNIHSDGSFDGNFHDSDMGVKGEDYPYGTVYYCDFTGQFGDVEKIDDTTYSMRMLNIKYANQPDTEEIKNSQKYIYTKASGLDGADEVLVYLPNTSIDDLPDGFVKWTSLLQPYDGDTIGYYGLYNVNANSGFFVPKH